MTKSYIPKWPSPTSLNILKIIEAITRHHRGLTVMCKLNHIGSKGIKHGVADQFTCQMNSKQFAPLELLGQQYLRMYYPMPKDLHDVETDEEEHT